MSLEKLRPFNATKFGILEMNIWELYPEIKWKKMWKGGWKFLEEKMLIQFNRFWWTENQIKDIEDAEQNDGIFLR